MAKVRLPGEGEAFQILSFDGGPNTLSYLRCLLEIERKKPGFVEATDLFAGTSDGALAAMFLASQQEPIDAATLERTIAFIEDVLLQIFSPNRYDYLTTGLAKALSTWPWPHLPYPRALLHADKTLRGLSQLGGATRAMLGWTTWSDHDELDRFMTQAIGPGPAGRLRMRDLRKPVCVVCYSLGGEVIKDKDGNPLLDDQGEVRRKRQRPKIYQSLDNDDDDADADAVAVALHSSSLPVFMPISSGHVDGAIYANNPAMCAVSVSMQMMADTAETRAELLGRLVVLSMGADDTHFGSARVQRQVTNTKTLRWGWLSWMLNGVPFGVRDALLIIDIVLNSDARAVSYQARQLLGERFLRVAPSGRKRTVEKFLNVLTGGAPELIAGARATAKEWAEKTDSERVEAPVNDDIAPGYNPDVFIGKPLSQRLSHRIQRAITMPEFVEGMLPDAGTLRDAMARNPNRAIRDLASQLDAPVEHGECVSLQTTLQWADEHWPLVTYPQQRGRTKLRALQSALAAGISPK